MSDGPDLNDMKLEAAKSLANLANLYIQSFWRYIGILNKASAKSMEYIDASDEVLKNWIPAIRQLSLKRAQKLGIDETIYKSLDQVRRELNLLMPQIEQLGEFAIKDLKKWDQAKETHKFYIDLDKPIDEQ